MEKKQIIILGTTPYSVSVSEIIQTENSYDVIAFCTKGDFIKEKSLNGRPVVAQEDLPLLYDMKKVSVLITIGYVRMNTLREKVYNEITGLGYNLISFVSERAKVYTSVPDSYGIIIMPGAYVGPEVEIGKCCVIRANATITHHILLGDYSFIGAGVVIGGNVVVGNNSFIGLNSTIKNKVKLAPYTLIGCGSNVISNVELYQSVCVGNPAHIIDDRKSTDTL